MVSDEGTCHIWSKYGKNLIF
ncbi:MAG: hypothetical protein ACTSPQ_20300 [Candidatus Helarchaeota archaeon]